MDIFVYSGGGGGMSMSMSMVTVSNEDDEEYCYNTDCGASLFACEDEALTR